MPGLLALTTVQDLLRLPVLSIEPDTSALTTIQDLLWLPGLSIEPDTAALTTDPDLLWLPSLCKQCTMNCLLLFTLLTRTCSGSHARVSR